MSSAHKCTGDCSNNAHDCEKHECETHAQSVKSKFKCRECIPRTTIAQCTNDATMQTNVLPFLFLGSCKQQSKGNSDKCVCSFDCFECKYSEEEAAVAQCEPSPPIVEDKCEGGAGAVKCLGDCSNNGNGCEQHDCNRHAQGLQSKYKCDSCTAISTVPECLTAPEVTPLLELLFLGSCKEKSGASDKCVCKFNCDGCRSADCPAEWAAPTETCDISSAHKCTGDCSNNAHDCEQHECDNHAQSVQSKFKCRECIPRTTIAQCTNDATMQANVLPFLFLGSCKHQSHGNSDKCVCSFDCFQCEYTEEEAAVAQCEPSPPIVDDQCTAGAVKCLGDCSNNGNGCEQHDCNLHAQGLQSKYKCDSCSAIATVPECLTAPEVTPLLDYFFLGSCKEQAAPSDKCVCKFNCVGCRSDDCPAEWAMPEGAGTTAKKPIRNKGRV